MHNHLTLNITKLKGTYAVCYDGREGIYGPVQTERFHQAFLAILEKGTGEDPLARELPLTGEGEAEALRNIRGREIFLDPEDTIPSLFRKAVEEYGDRPALYAGEDCLTYRELDRLSSRVANGLLHRGVQQGQRVLYMMNRDIRLLPVMLGISKAGARLYSGGSPVSQRAH